MVSSQDVYRSVVIVDDFAGFRRWAGELLSAEGFDVVGEASDGASALREVERLRPDVVLLDVRLPDMDGFQVAARLMERPMPPAVILTSSRDRGEYRTRLAATSARGFVAKQDLCGHSLRAAIEASA